MKAMIDTNVLLDIYLVRDEFVDDGLEVLRLIESKQLHGLVTAKMVTDVYYIMHRQIKDLEELKRFVREILHVFKVMDVTAKDIHVALALPMMDFEDALLAQCAKRAKAEYIITRNIKDFAGSPVPAITPAAFVQRFAA